MLIYRKSMSIFNFSGESSFSFCLILNNLHIVLIIIKEEFCCNLLGRSYLSLIKCLTAINQSLTSWNLSVYICECLNTVHALIKVMSPKFDICVIWD